MTDNILFYHNRILINKLSIDAPILSLRTKPIVAFVDELFIEICETSEISRNNAPTDSTSSKER